MASQLRIVHHTGYRYAGLIGASHNEARMTPRATREQVPLATKVEVTPVAWIHNYVDYWGTPVTAFEITEPHSRLDVVATSTVDVGERAVQAPGAEWDDFVEPNFADRYIEWLVIGDHVDPGSELRKLSQETARQADQPSQAAAEILSLIRKKVAYVPGSTQVNTSASAVWANGAGVCQDLVHLSLGALRTVGIPCRYVSGYVMPQADPAIGEARTGESHAWLQFWDGAWVGVDPTNDTVPGDFHVEIGVGRDYFDVPPLKGVYAGSESSDLFVEVEITRLG
jgi:transglutaminase-like putative cysteine protease